MGGSQKVIVGAEGEEAVDALDGGALKHGPVAAEEGDDHKQCHQPVAHQNPLHGHPQHPSLYTLRHTHTHTHRDASFSTFSDVCLLGLGLFSAVPDSCKVTDQTTVPDY